MFRSLKLGTVVDRANSFDAIRLAAAVAVILSHSWVLSSGPGSGGDPIRRLLEFESASHIGVAIFFAISGFLVTRSWVRRPKIRKFAVNRILRLIPALAIVSALLAFVVGPLVTSESLGSYFTSPETWGYAIQNSILQTEYTLPGVFTDNPFPEVVNGSLWTLPLEARSYLVVGLLGLVGLVSARMKLVPVALVGLLLFLSLETTRGAVPVAETLGDWLGTQLFLEYYALFAMGGVMYLWRDRIRLAWLPALAAAAVWVLTAGPLGTGEGFHLLASVLLLPYVVLSVAYLSGDVLTRPLRGIDASYGAYVYAFPIQQLLAGAFVLTPLAMFALAAPLAVGMGVISWLLVERRALALKDHRLVRRATGVTPAPAHAKGSGPRAQTRTPKEMAPS